MSALERLVAELGLPLGTYVVCLISGFIPLVNAELFLIGAKLLAPASASVPLVVIGTAGQITAKIVMYYGAQGLMKLPRRPPPAALEKPRVKLEAHPRRAWWLTFLAGSIGVPPLYLLSIAAGLLRMPFVPFVALASTGRLLRFGVVVLFPHLLSR